MNRPGARCRVLLLTGFLAMAAGADDVTTLLDFDSPEDAALFAPVDDAVMGGLSQSRLVPAGDGIAAFTGEVSLENRGGFASVRSRAREWPTAGAQAFVLRLRGDGKRYRFNLRTADGPSAFRYEAELDLPAGAWTEVEVSLSAFQAKAFGRKVPLLGPPDAARIRSLGFMISGKQAGPFRLEIDWIAVR